MIIIDFNGHVHTIHNHFKIFSIDTLNIRNINMGTPIQKQIKLINNFTVQEKRKFTPLSTKYQEVFTCSYKYMPEIDRDIVEHQIPTRPEDTNRKDGAIIRQFTLAGGNNIKDIMRGYYCCAL